MQQARKFAPVDEFDREYKSLQRPADAVAKNDRSLQLSDTLREPSLDDDRKVREYVAGLQRYLNVGKEGPRESTAKVNPLTEPLPPPPPPPARNESSSSPPCQTASQTPKTTSSGHPTDMEAIYIDVCSPGSFGGIQRSFVARGEDVSGRTGHVYVTQTEKNSLSTPQDIFQRYRGSLPDRSRGRVQPRLI